MSSTSLTYVPFVFSLVGLGFLVAIAAWFRLNSFRRKKRPPFTKNMLRSPGESIRQELDKINIDLMESIAFTILLPAMVGGMVAIQLQRESIGTALALGFIAVFIALFSALRLKRLVDRRTPQQLAWEGERAVGEELNQLMLQGYRVYHDFPAEHFNIDHVVIGPRGVFAVETKTRSKAPRGSGSDAAKIKFDGKALQFPDHQETEPLAQADRQAIWLAKWLTQAVGETFPVTPVLVLPGWYVKMLGTPKRVFVLGSGSIQSHFLTLGNSQLSPEQIQRIAYQVEQRCRTVEPWTPKMMRKDSIVSVA